MTSPPRLRRSPARLALHERSQSQTNERDSPTLRHVESSQGMDVGPFPTKPSQILRPSGHYTNVPTSKDGTAAGPYSINHGNTAVQELRFLPEGWHNQPRTDLSASDLPHASTTDMSSLSASDSRATLQTTSTTEHGGSSTTLDTSSLLVARSKQNRLTSEHRAQSDEESIYDKVTEGRQPVNKDSDNSLSSTNTTGTVIVKKKRASYSAFPYSARPASSKSNQSITTSREASPVMPGKASISTASGSPKFPNSSIPPSPERRSSSAPSASSHDIPPGSASQLQYPVIRPPSASGSWAHSSTQPPPIPTKAAERGQPRWNPHLSTVPSEGTDSLSLSRSSGLALDSTRGSRSSPRFSSISTGIGGSPDLGTSSPEMTQGPFKPSFVASVMPRAPTEVSVPLPARSRDFSGSTIRVVEGEEDGQKPGILQPIPGSRGSELPQPVGVRRPNLEATTRPSSTASFFRDSIPGWARNYYKRPGSQASFSNRDSFHAEDVNHTLRRPRNRDPQRPERPDRRQSGLNMHPTKPQDLVQADRRVLSQVRRISPTPSAHLWRDRASAYQRRSLFIAPSIDEAAEGHALTKRNVQVLAFVFGFVLPFCWFIAAALPLPPKPPPTLSKGKASQRTEDIAAYLEKQLNPTDLSRYENARWWRNINRIMCAVGITIIILIVSLARSRICMCACADRTTDRPRCRLCDMNTQSPICPWTPWKAVHF